MNHNLFILFTGWKGDAVYINPDAVSAVLARVEEPDEQNPVRSFIYTVGGEDHHVQEEAGEIVETITLARDAMNKQAEDAKTNPAA